MSAAPSGVTGSGSGRLPSRREVLRAGAVSALTLLAAGCHSRGADSPHATSGSPAGGGASTSASTADADVRLLTRAIADEQHALDFCAAAYRRFPRQRDLLGEAADVQREHVARLRHALVDAHPLPPDRTSPRLPHTADDVPASLLRIENALQEDRTADCLGAVSGLLAELFGSLAASAAMSAAALAPTTPTGTPRILAPRTVRDVTVLAPCLAAEHAALYGYGIVGGVLEAGTSDDALAEAATVSYDAHRARRDVLTQLFAAAGQQAPAAHAAYALPLEVTGPATARRLARLLETRCAAVYLREIGASVGDGRRFVSAALVDCATREVTWGGRPAAFPGLTA